MIPARLLRAGVIAVLASACAGKPTQPGFEERFESLYVTRPEALTWRRAAADPGTYRQVQLMPLQAILSASGGRLPVRASSLEVVGAAYERVVRGVLEPDVPCVRSGGPGTLRLSAVLTDRITVPELRQHGRARHLAADSRGYLGRVALEARFHDGASGAMVAAFISVAGADALERSLTGPPSLAELEPLFGEFASRLKVALDAAVRR